MRAAMLLVALVACGEGDSAYDVVDCEADAWKAPLPQFAKCERACAAGPACDFNDTACMATLGTCKQPNGLMECGTVSQAVFDGKRGCCKSDGPSTLVFVECVE